jgi:alkylation response protein AidB-like acyl-CoA dehydrogenase
LNGPLEYLVLGALAGQALIPAKISGQEGFSLFLVKIAQNGITKSGPVASLGLHACPAVDISFNAVTAEIVGAKGRGQQYYEAAADRFSVAAAAISSGIMKGAFQEAHAYSAERFQGGRAIIDWSMLRMILADMAVKVEIADMAVTQACRALAEASPRASLQARAAALHVQELSTSLTTDGIQVLGGYGYMKDFGQEKRFRDAKQAQSLLGLFPMKKLKYIEYLRKE